MHARVLSAFSGLSAVLSCEGDTGNPNDPGLLLDGHDRGTITATGTQALPADSAGIHAVGLNGIAANCRPAEENPQPITLLPDETANLTFTSPAACLPPKPGS